MYNQFLNVSKRRLITRWRLSCHRLRIETGRLESPKLERRKRTCAIRPEEVEDEHHVRVLFKCPIYDQVRNKFASIFGKHDSVEGVLNPSDVKEADLLGSFLSAIEKIRQNRGMEFVDS